MKLETPRLYLIALTEEQLRLYLLADNTLETHLGLTHRPRQLSERVKFVLETKIIPAVSDPSNNPLYATFWTIVDKSQNMMVADLCFKGEPDANGEVEIGYGTYPDFEGNGYMTEAVGRITEWAFTQEQVKTILAQTDPANRASQRILEKNKFVLSGTAADNLNWRLEKTAH